MKIVKPSWIKHGNKGNVLSIFSIDIHPDGTKVATGGQGNDCGRVAIWNMSPVISPNDELKENIPKLLCQIDSHLQCVNAVRWSNMGKFLASAGDDQLIMIWTLSCRYSGPGPIEQYRTVSTLRSHSGDILDLSWSPDDQWLASCSVDNTIVVWNAQRWPEITAILKGHSGLVKGVTWDPIGKYLASQSDDKTLRVWRISDWTEEVCVKEPFEQCGGTTHVLRLSWSPDGLFLVSAQAMNNCGSVAKIINRQDWSFRDDFVGHRKAIPCVKFNPKIFKYKTSNRKKDTEDNKEVKLGRQCVIAVGSRDRSISIWATARRRPLLVIGDIFENSVLDISWDSSGYRLMACSSDGSVAYLEFTEKELGLSYSHDEREQCLQQLYGNSVGNKSATFKHLIEDIDILMVQNKRTDSYTNGGVVANSVEAKEQTVKDTNEKMPEATKPLSNNANGKSINCSSQNNNNSSNSSSLNCSKNQQQSVSPTSKLAKGPTDKQIEIRSADGRRRIIPLFIPPSNGGSNDHSLANSASIAAVAASASQPLSFSSSSESKSKIVIETRDESNPSVNSQPNDNQANETFKSADRKSDSSDVANNNNNSSSVKTTKPNETSSQKETIETQDRPKSPKLPNTSSTMTNTNGISNSKNNIISDDSSDDEIVIKRHKGLSAKRKSMDSGSSAPPPSQNTTITAAPPPPPPVKRKPGRPPGSGSLNQSKAQTVVDAASSSQISRPPPVETSNRAPSNSMSRSQLTGQYVFPPLRLEKESRVSVKLFTSPDSGDVYTACIEYPLSKSSICKLSLLAGNETNWNVLLSTAVVAVSANEHMMVCVCDDQSINVFNMKTGRRLYTPIMLESPVARMVCCNKSQLLVITCTAHLWLWDILMPKVLVKGESLSPLIRSKSSSEPLSLISASVSPSDKPLVTISNGRTYLYETELSSWCLVGDLNDPLNACTDLKSTSITANRNLSSLNRIPSRSLLNFFSSNTPTAQHALISFIEQQIQSAKVMGSAKDYRHWTLTLAQNLVSLHSAGFHTDNIENRLRELCTFLLGSHFPRLKNDDNPKSPSHSSTPMHISRKSFSAQLNNSKLSDRNANKIVGINKHELLQEVLSVLVPNLALQRLYLEYKEQLDSFGQFNTFNSTYLNASKANENQSLSCISLHQTA